MDEKYILKIQELIDKIENITRRIDELEDKTQSNTELALSVKELTIEIKYMRKDYQELAEKHAKEVQAIDNRLSEVEKKPVQRYEQVVGLVITGIVTAILGVLFGKFGLQR